MRLLRDLRCDLQRGGAHRPKCAPALPALHPLLEKDCDLLVLGGGGSGLVAAARAAWLSGKRVIVVEKGPKPGGGAWYAADFKIYNSRWQQQRDIPDILEDSVRRAMDDTYWKLDPQLARNCFQATGAFFDWLCDTGERVEDQFREGTYIFDGPNGPVIPVFKQMRRGRQGGTGKFVVDQMTALCQRLGVEILTGHKAVELFSHQDLVTGALVRDAGGMTRITCRACVLATGSWIGDQQLLERVDPKFAAMSPVRSPHRSPKYTGDGLRLARQVGAKLDYDSFCLRLMGPLLMAADGTPYQTLGAMLFDPSVIFVNQNGKRWINEQTGPRKGFFDTAISLREQPGGISFTLFDANCIAHAVERAKGGGQRGIFGGVEFPKDWKADMDAAAKEYPFALYQADSVEALGRQNGGRSPVSCRDSFRTTTPCAPGDGTRTSANRAKTGSPLPRPLLRLAVLHGYGRAPLAACQWTRAAALCARTARPWKISMSPETLPQDAFSIKAE